MTISASSCLPGVEFLCDGQCKPKSIICDGFQHCWDNADEANCQGSIRVEETPPNLEVAKQIVIPTILACIFMVGVMLFGIRKCKEWELDRISDMRRTRRIVMRLTARLREKNCQTLQKARDMRKRALLAQKAAKRYGTLHTTENSHTTDQPSGTTGAPPIYDSEPPFVSGNSPPPAYEDALFHEYYDELFRESERRNSGRNRHSASSGGSGTSNKRRRGSRGPRS